MSNQAKKLTIEQIQKKLFEIPPYQRLYEWESTQIEELLNDIKKAWDESNQYFIGNITTSIDKKDSNKFILIDGQQRLTTLWFIGFYLASLEYEWETKDKKYKKVWQDFILQNDKLRIAMPIRDNEEKALKELAMKIHTIKPNENGEINLYAYLPSDIHQKVINAFECIEKWFNARFGKYINGKLEIDLKQLKCFSLFIYIRVCFVFVELAQNTDLNRFFVRMNNRGKQLEKHEILKARILDKIKDDKSDEWQKNAKIWDLCSDMNKYIFQSASDRKVLNSVSDDNKGWNIDRIIKEFNDKNTKNKDNDDTPDKVESIIDFPTFLLHCYKLWAAKKCSENEIPKEITITKDNLLEIMWDNQANNGKNKEVILDECIFNNKNDTNGQAKANCKEFIESMLRYRVLFDYFVIKNNAEQGNGFRIRRLQPYKDKNQKTYYRLPEDNKLAMDSPLHNLAMIQNYLRVARSGDRQNYHHWLTPFLGFLDNHIRLEMNLSLIKNCAFDFDNFKCGAKKIAEQFSKDECDGRQKVLVRFLENLDTKLAIKQTNQTNDNGLLGVANEILGDLKSVKNISKNEAFANNKSWDSLLNNGTGTPHYWFYRLEYYLWKNAKKIETDLSIADNNFSKIASKFYFRNLNSIEHIHPQSIDGWGQDNKVKEIDKFGNLALLSVGFNSTLSNDDGADKYIKLLTKIKKDNIESLKLWLVYAKHYDKQSESWVWDKDKAQAHQKLMIDILIESLKDSQGN